MGESVCAERKMMMERRGEREGKYGGIGIGIGDGPVSVVGTLSMIPPLLIVRSFRVLWIA
jgi:hypothetical protein